jgi:hypothetical protein
MIGTAMIEVGGIVGLIGAFHATMGDPANSWAHLCEGAVGAGIWACCLLWRSA